MTLSVRSFWLPSALVAYVCFAAVQVRSGSVLPWIALVGLPLLLAETWRRTHRPPRGVDPIDPAARSALRACVWGGAMWLAARSGPSGHAAFDAAANLGSGTCSVAALVALARIAPLGGILTPHGACRSLDAAAFSALLWAIAAALPATRALLPAQLVRLDPLAVDYATTTAGVGSLLVFVAATTRLKILRRLELGVNDRASGALALSITSLLVVVPAAALNVAAPDRLLPIGVILSALACSWVATTRDPTTVSSALRGILAVVILGAPVTLLAAVLAQQASRHAGAIVLATSGLAILVGLIARAVARPLGPEQSRWLDAIDAASRGALQPEPDAAIRAALEALSKATATAGAKPELWRYHPEEVLSVDIAGYLHVEAGRAPPRLYELALAEPERTLRAEALQAVQVRRAEVRPLLEWFESRRAFSATLILDEDGPLGFLLLPRGSRRAVMALEEARAARILADRISALLAVSSALARSRRRELDASERAAKLEQERQRLEQIIQQSAGKNRLSAERAADSIRRTAYSAAARLTVDQIERLARRGIPIALMTPRGVDATGWAAVAHLASPRSGGPFLVVDGARGTEHDPDRWQSEQHSPLGLADGGTLVVLAAAALPVTIQEILARHLARVAPSQEGAVVPPAGLVLTSSRHPGELATSGQLVRSLERHVPDAVVELPPLMERAEDLRALVLDQLARVGLQERGEPLGVDPGALRLLLDHRWPGNDLELRDVLTRAAGVATGKLVSMADLASIGFRPDTEHGVTGTPLPVVPRLRSRGRRTPRGR